MPSKNTDLAEAYRRTTYVASTPRGDLRVRIGEGHAGVDALLRENGAEGWAYITAWNPGSEPLGLERNRARQEELERQVRDAGYGFYRGQSEADDGNWPAEESLLVLGISRGAAVCLGVKHGQNAIVCGEFGGAAELVWCLDDGKAQGALGKGSELDD